MKTSKRQRFEIVFYAVLSGLLGVGVGYYWAAATAAEKVKEFMK